jgi:beta-lactamase family protein
MVPRLYLSTRGCIRKCMTKRLLALPLLLACVCEAQDVGRLDQVAQSYASSNRFMGSVLVARGGEMLVSKGYGFANLEWNIPNSPQAKFRLGSVTKQFTAACILLLEDGRAGADALGAKRDHPSSRSGHIFDASGTSVGRCVLKLSGSRTHRSMFS